MGILIVCACHTCKKFIDLNKMHTYWLNDEAISFEPEYFDTVDTHYELHHSYQLLRFVFLHQQKDCRIDLIPSTEEDHYFYAMKNYEEVDFDTDMNDTPWEPIWERSQENISFLNVSCRIGKVETIPIEFGREIVKSCKYAGKKPRVGEFVMISMKGKWHSKPPLFQKATQDMMHRAVGMRGSEEEFGMLPNDEIWIIFQGIIHQKRGDDKK